MKDIFCIIAYPYSYHTKNVLLNCLDSLQKFRDKFDILLSTHLPITDMNIYDKLDYIIYDKKNERHDNVSTYFYNDAFDVCISGGYSLPASLCIFNFMKFAKDTYKFFYFSEGDNIFSEEDINKMIELKNSINEKKLIFNNYRGKIDSNNESDKLNFPSHFFMGDLEFLWNKCKSIPKTIEDIYKTDGIFENIIADILREHLENILFIEYSDIFKTSKFNLSYKSFYSEVLYNKNNNNHVIYVVNSSGFNKKIKIFIDNNIVYEGIVYNGCWYLNFLNDSKHVKAEIYFEETDIIDYIKEFNINEEFLKKIEPSFYINFFNK